MKNLLSRIGSGVGEILREDGFFFVVATLLNLPIIAFEDNIQSGAINFLNGALAIFIVTAASHLLPKKIRRPLQVTAIIFFALLFVVNVFLLKSFGVPLNTDTLQVLLGTNPLTAKAFLQEYVANFKVLGSLAAFILLLTALSFGLKKFFTTRSEKRLKLFAIDLLIIFLIPLVFHGYVICRIMLILAENMLFNTTPLHTAKDIQFIAEHYPMGNESKIFAEMDRQLETEKIIGNESDIPFVIFVLGESTDRNHMQLYGYNLPTTPRLTARHERGEIFRFTDTIACGNNTSSAMALIFNFAEKDEPKDDWYLKANIFDIVRRAGYHTFWLSNQSPRGVFGNFDKYFSARCDEKFFVEAEGTIANERKIDGVLLPVLDDFLAASTAEKNFYVIHLYGTHGAFKERYPADFEKFSAADIAKPEESWRQGTAEYDNAVLYNDFIMDEIIRRFEDKTAVLIYISDHGEEVYDGRDFAWHSLEEEGNVHMIEIPALVWASEKFRERYPEKISALNSALDRPYRTDYLIHALLELMDIRTTSFDATKSILNQNFTPRPRIYNGLPYVNTR